MRRLGGITCRQEAQGVDREAVHHEMDQARVTFSDLVSKATPADLRRRSNGTRWTNRQLLFHMLFGYLIVRTLMPLVHGFGHLPEGWSRRFAATLNTGQRPFHLINYLGSLRCRAGPAKSGHDCPHGSDRPRSPAQAGR
jgi:hypothetical protein